MKSSNGPKTALRASFIVTVATLVGCSAAQPEPEMTHNPPMPTTTAPTVVVATATPVDPPEPPDPDEPDEPAGLPDAPTDRPGHVERNGDKCTWVTQYEPSPCPPGASCNPPAPESFEVKCPATPEPKLPFAPVDVVVQKRADGRCFYTVPRGPAKQCPPGMSCNPPSPRRHEVRCPEN